MISKGPIKVFTRRGKEGRVYCFTERVGTITKFIGAWWYTPVGDNPEKLMAKTRRELIDKIHYEEIIKPSEEAAKELARCPKCQIDRQAQRA